MPPATYLDNHCAPDVDDMLDLAARQQDEADWDWKEPLPYDPEQLHAARDLRGQSWDEHLHRQVEHAGEESQNPGTEDTA